MIVTVMEGHYPGPDAVASPVWSGPLEEFIANNEGIDLNEVNADLILDGFHQTGGGAAGCFTIVRSDDGYGFQEWAEMVAVASL